ncbi:MAG: CocE/NonD family hydrolase [Bacteroidia bacterium]
MGVAFNPAACTANPNRGEDGYDVVEWIATQTWSNGRIVLQGPSALGKNSISWTAKENPPSLDCIVPLVAGSQTNYEEYFPGGSRPNRIYCPGWKTGDLRVSIYYSNPVKNIVWDIVERGILSRRNSCPCYDDCGWYDHNVIVMMELFPQYKVLPPDVRENHRFMWPWVHGGTGPAYVGSKVQGELEYPGSGKMERFTGKGFSRSLVTRSLP